MLTECSVLFASQPMLSLQICIPKKKTTVAISVSHIDGGQRSPPVPVTLSLRLIILTFIDGCEKEKEEVEYRVDIVEMDRYLQWQD